MRSGSILACAVLALAACQSPPPPAPPLPDAAVVAAPAPPPHLVSRADEAMGTFVEIKVWTTQDDAARAAIGEALDEVKRIERLMTTWREESDISKVNAAAGKNPVEVSPETLECVQRSLDFSRRSHGAFDISFYALKGLWKFDQDLEARLPDPAEVARRVKLIDYRKIVVDEAKHTLFLKEAGMRINLGGIAKGYAVDRATAILKKHGFKDAIVQAGGDLMLAGSKSGAPWMAGIRDPRGPRDDYFALAGVTDHAFSTAGDYERFFFIAGKRYHHIIDPKTGYPATRARSVTIWAPDATTADGLDDGVLILGPTEGMAMIEAMGPEIGAVIVDADNNVHVSPSMKKIYKQVHPPTAGP